MVKVIDNRGTNRSAEPPVKAPSAGDARSLAALIFTATLADELGIHLRPGQLQGAVETLIAQSVSRPIPSDFDAIVEQNLSAVIGYRRGEGFFPINQADTALFLAAGAAPSEIDGAIQVLNEQRAGKRPESHEEVAVAALKALKEFRIRQRDAITEIRIEHHPV